MIKAASVWACSGVQFLGELPGVDDADLDLVVTKIKQSPNPRL
jgi:hypothetical protein